MRRTGLAATDVHPIRLPPPAHDPSTLHDYGETMFGDLAPAQSVLIAWVAGSLLSFIVSCLILWLIIRGAVLSALRKHAAEQRELGRDARHRGPGDPRP